MNENTHIGRFPLVLLRFLQEVNKSNFTPLPVPFKFSFIIESTYSSITVIEHAWFNTVELLRIREELERYNLKEVNFLEIKYQETEATISENLMVDANMYEVSILLDIIAGDGITFGHN